VHGADEAQALTDAAGAHGLLHLGRQVDVAPPRGHLQPQLFAERFHARTLESFPPLNKPSFPCRIPDTEKPGFPTESGLATARRSGRIKTDYSLQRQAIENPLFFPRSAFSRKGSGKGFNLINQRHSMHRFQYH
jgi:hypothetical protein